MIVEYNDLAVDLDRVRRFLESGSNASQTLDQRRFGYIACISALYSSFENFSERLVFRFSERLLTDPARLSADQMQTLRKSYVQNASSLLGKDLGSGRFEGISHLDVAKSLASCLDDTSPNFDLRLEVIGHHTSNIRWDTLCGLFRWAVPDLTERIRHSDAVREWMSVKGNINDSTLPTVLKSELDDLVERRNEVAHRAIPDEILSYDRLLDKVAYIRAISLGLVSSLAGLLLIPSSKDPSSTLLGKVKRLYKNNRVVLIESLQRPISIDDYVLVAGGDKASTRWGRLLGLMVGADHVREAGAGEQVSIHLEFATRKNADLHIISESSSDLMAPPQGIFGKYGPQDE